MASRMFLLAGACAVVLLGPGPGCERMGPGGTAVFTDQAFDTARAEAKAAGKIFLVDATASWCVPCKRMDETTWPDDRVRSWIAEHAVALQFDVDEHSARAKALRIEGMPTLIVFKGDDEFDRVIGYQDADQLLAWLDGVLEGRRAIDALREAAGERAGAAGTVDVQARLQLAEALAGSGEYLAAADEFAWLWDNMLDHDRAMYGVRLSYMVSDMARLAARSEDAKAKFVALRDRYQSPIDAGTAAPEQVDDWLSLNQVVDDEQRTLEWYERVKDDPGAAEQFRRVRREIFELLVRRNRLADAGRVHPDPSGVARRMVEMNEMTAAYESGESGLPKEQLAEIRKYREEHFRSELAELYATCLAAGRDDPAEGVAAVLLEARDDARSREQLVQAALRVERPLERHRAWIDQARERGGGDAQLRAQLEAALAAQP